MQNDYVLYIPLCKYMHEGRTYYYLVKYACQLAES